MADLVAAGAQKEAAAEPAGRLFSIDVEWFAANSAEADVKALAAVRATQNPLRVEYGKVTEGDARAGQWFIRTYWRRYS